MEVTKHTMHTLGFRHNKRVKTYIDICYYKISHTQIIPRTSWRFELVHLNKYIYTNEF